MAKNKSDGWDIISFIGEFNHTIIAAQQRNMRFAQGVFDNSLEVLKSHTEAARILLEEVAEKPEKQTEVAQEIVNTMVSAYDRNLRLTQSIFNDGIEVLKNSAVDTRELAQEMLEQSQKQQGQFPQLMQEATNAYVNFLRMPLTYYRQTLNKATSMA